MCLRVHVHSKCNIKINITENKPFKSKLNEHKNEEKTNKKQHGVSVS